MADEENYDLYTIEDILNKVDKKYLDFIAKKIPKPNKQRTIYGDKISINLRDMAKFLKTEMFFRQSFSSLSNDAKSFMFYLSSEGRTISLQPMLEKDEKIYMNDIVKECLDKLMIFGLPSKTDPEVLIMPLDYTFSLISDARKEFDMSLAYLMKHYPKPLFQQISDYYGLSYRAPVNSTLTDTYIAIIKNLNTTLNKLNSKEREILEYMISNRGVAVLWALFEQCKIKKASSYYYGIEMRDLLLQNSFIGGEAFISLIKSGLLFASGGPYSDNARYVIIPNEIVRELRRITNDNGHQESTPHKKRNDAHMEELKNYGYDLSENIKKICLALYYLDLRSQRGTDKAIWKIISIPESEFLTSVKFGIREGFMVQTKSYLSLTTEGEELLAERFFASKLHKNILIEYIFSYWGHDNDIKVKPTDVLRHVYLAYICNMKTPENMGDMFRSLMSNDITYNILREMEWNIIKSGNLYGYQNNVKALSGQIDTFSKESFYEIVELLKMYNFIRLSSAELKPETLIFPEKQLIEIYENPKKLPVREERGREKKPLKMLPNNEILMEIESSFEDLKEISGFATLISADVVCTFRITKDSLSKYMNNLGNLDRVRDFLKNKSSMDAPDTIRRLIDDMDSRKNEIEITRCQAVLQVKDRTIIDSIMTYKSLSDMIEKRLTPETLAIKEDVSLYHFVTEVRKKGYIIPVLVEKEKSRRRSYNDPIRW